MPSQPDPAKVAIMVDARARGLSKRAAAREAGYAEKTNSFYETMKGDEFKERVVKRKRQLELASADLAVVIVALMDAAQLATQSRLGDFTAAARMLAEAARLKQGLSATEGEDPFAEAARRWKEA